MDIDELKRRLFNHFNIEEDELKAMGITSQEDLQKLYKGLCSKGDDNTEPQAEDGHELNTNERKTLASYKKGRRKAASIKAKADFEAKAAPLDHLPPAERVTYEETQKAMADLGISIKARRNIED